jgi:dimethylhistidine N-methyltransferase
VEKGDIIINPCDLHSDNSNFRADVFAGLQKKQKELPAKYFYDTRGSELFESICMLDEYYIPSTEISILNANIEEIVSFLGENVVLVEYGCGDCSKTRILLSYLRSMVAFIPVDISRQQLIAISRELIMEYPDLEILPVCADYTNTFSLPMPKRVGRSKVVFFPGSSIGNFEPKAATEFLKRINRLCGKDGALLIGIDLKKDPAVLYRAYNDSQGVTAAFNLNLLERVNYELDGDFKIDYFKHHAFYNQSKSRVEMHLVSLKEQVVNLDNLTVSFTKGESIWTESSYKYHIDDFENMANASGFILKKAWIDEKQWFSIMYFIQAEQAV